tara:strand:+ start:347 stop:538 length:192 start_codon:yes stop_codon:yes gene_type:complete
MSLDILAWFVLFSLWLFGGAALFDNNNTEYKEVFIGWTVLNVFFAGVALMVFSAVWALERLYT